MTAAEPVKNPQRLAPFSKNSLENSSENKRSSGLSLHQKRQATVTQSLPVKHRGSSSYPENGSAVSASPPSLPSSPSGPIEIGKTGDTDRRTAHRLRRGKLQVDARLDLHGCTVYEAHDRLLEFLRVSQSTGARCVLVVTGKGRRRTLGIGNADQDSEHRPGKLRVSVPRWLNEPAFRPLVLSVSHATPKDGGEGALYILLRKTSKNGPLSDLGRRS